MLVFFVGGAFGPANPAGRCFVVATKPLIYNEISLAWFLLLSIPRSGVPMPTLPYTAHTVARPAATRVQPMEVIAKKPKAEATAFETMVDAINPLQQIPGVGQAYRKVSGDKSSNGAQLAGHVAIGAALGGPIGAGIGAGIFVLEKTLPAVFNTIGKLFSSGKNSDSQADMPKFSSEPHRDTTMPRRPLIEGLDIRPGSKPARTPLPKLGQATPNMSMAQFDALMQSIGAQPIEASGASNTKSSATSGDVSTLLQANLDKYRRQQQQASGVTGR
jgi:hypothetical protein